ncbi:uncharacterized protein [Macrobrachium rosenbergii]|uniref:uncharacterized protein isoform X2 n=1 Tax=Macrobrachium rosenbergii TaxID=79674 RepID=UPI0034D488AD
MMLVTLIVLVAYGLSGYSGYCLGVESLKNEDGSGHTQSHSLSLGKFHQPSFRSFQESGREGGRRGGGGSRRGSEKGGGGRKHLHLYGVEVPVYKFRGEDAQLECKYDPGEEPLYSVKWYKDDNEFYTYLFRKPSPKKTFPIPGVIVDLHRSNERRVLLKELTFNSTGIYKCEVSADSPHFRTYDNQSIMVVVGKIITTSELLSVGSRRRFGEQKAGTLVYGRQVSLSEGPANAEVSSDGSGHIQRCGGGGRYGVGWRTLYTREERAEILCSQWII